MTPAVPESVWEGREHTSIHAAVVSAGLQSSEAISAILSPADYDALINTFQQTMLQLVDALRSDGMPIGEAHVAGTQARVCFYDPEEVHRNCVLDGPDVLARDERARLIAQCRASNQNLAISALKFAIQQKSAWLVQDCNVERVLSHLDPWELKIGIHYGRVYLGYRADDRRRIEGHALDVAECLRRFDRPGKYSRIIVSQRLHDVILSSVVKHTQLRQRVFFHRHEEHFERTEGVAQAQPVFELKFYHLIGIHVPEEVIEQYEAIFALNRGNIWAYYQLADYYSHVTRNWTKLFELTKKALLVHPKDEKVLLDLAKFYLHQGKLSQSRKCAREALAANESFDLAHEHLAVIACKMDDVAGQIEHWRDAVHLSPDSPVNNFNLGLALLANNQPDEGYHFVREALRIYPGYKEWQVFREALRSLKNAGQLPELLEVYLEQMAEEEEKSQAGKTTPAEAS